MNRHYAMWRMICLLCACLALAACCAWNPGKMGGDVADLQNFPQDLRIYANKAGADSPLLDAVSQAAHWEQCKRLHFSPWQAQKVSIGKENAFSALNDGGYAGNLLPRSAADWDALKQNSNQSAYPGRPVHGITVRATALRAAPTAMPRFNNPLAPGEGYPFDMWQYATLPLGMPLLMTHTAADGAWIFVESALAAGWVAEQDLAEVDAAFMEQYRKPPLCAVLRDGVKLSVSGKIMALVGIGTLLPRMENSLVLIPVRDAWGRVQAVSAEAEAGTVQNAPLPLLPENLAAIGNELMGQAYGWGGLYGNRDCSAMLRDVFIPFGIWLPRNSSAQAQAWAFASLRSVPIDKKEEYILRHARPFATLLWLPGHIALYIGEYGGRAALFHDFWAIRTEVGGREGRYILGRTLISGVRPGIELPDMPPGSDLLTRIQGMTVLQGMREQ